MSKPLLFISHIAPEKEVAIALKTLVEREFLNMIDVFVSSDDSTIGLGQKWLDAITDGLRRCAVEIIVASPVSVKRPWINFEAGSGWIREIPVIPLCHSGMLPSGLPVPLNLLQAAVATEVSQLKLVFPVLAKALGSASPNPDFTAFIQQVKDFETRYTFWEECNRVFRVIDGINSDIIPNLKMGKTIVIDLTETQINALQPILAFLSNNRLLTFRRVGNVKMTTGGTFYDCHLVPESKLGATLADSNFNP
jgi:hypothetical protein